LIARPYFIDTLLRKIVKICTLGWLSAMDYHNSATWMQNNNC